MQTSVEAKNAALQGIADRLNIGANSVLSIYVGATLAAEITLTNPVEDSITGGVMTFKAPPKVIAIATGAPTAARIFDDSGVLMAELDVATELSLDKPEIYAGGYVTLVSLTMGV